MRDPDFTLAAGPTAATARTLAALGSPITYHYDPVFLDAFRRTEAKVGQLFRTSNEIILMQGEAVLGLEAAARSLVHPGMHVLNLVSGVFGKGMGYWLKNFGADLHELEVPYDQAVAPEAVEQYLDQHPETELLCVVHSETPSGTFNDCGRIGPVARSRGVLTLVDCVSSLGGMRLDTDPWQLDVCVAGPQKCLAGPPGMSLMAVSGQAWAAIEANPAAPRASFLSLLDWREQWHGQGRFPYTPSVSDIHGVEAACDQVLEEGLEASIARHEAGSRWTRPRDRSQPRARALRRDAVGRAGRGEPGADRSHGAGGQRPQSCRRADGARPIPGRPRRSGPRRGGRGGGAGPAGRPAAGLMHFARSATLRVVSCQLTLGR